MMADQAPVILVMLEDLESRADQGKVVVMVVDKLR
jgi:hypothetical protein